MKDSFLQLEWKQVRLGSIVNLDNGFAFKSQSYVKKGILSFRVTNIRDNGRINIGEKVEYLPMSFAETYRKYLLKDGDILVVMVGATRGKIAYITNKILPALLNQNMWKISSLDCTSVNPKFLYYYLSFVIPNFINRFSESTRGFFKKEDFKAIQVILPSLQEQLVINEVLDLIQGAINLQEKLILLTKELKSTLIHKLIIEGINNEPQKHTNIGNIPESWEVKPLSQLINVIGYGTSVKCDYQPEGFPVLRIPNIVGGSIDYTDLKYGRLKKCEIDNLKLKNGDLLFVRTNGVKENAGRCSIFNSKMDNCFYASYLIRVHLDNEQLLPEFFNEYSKTEVGKSFLSGKANRTADGKYNINIGTIKNVLVPLPHLSEQTEIVNILTIIEQKNKLNIQKLALLTELFKSLLQKIMTKQIDTSEFEFKELE